MKKLKAQVFAVIFLIMTLFTTAVFVAYNTMEYHREYTSIERSLNQTERMEFDRKPLEESEDFKPDAKDFGSFKFVDKTVYTVIFDSDGSVSKVINHSDNSVTDDEIKEIATTMASQSLQKEIGNLYFADYSYQYRGNQCIVLVDNAETKAALRTTLLYSLVLYLLIEAIIFIASRLLTLRITKPVAESFEKQKQFIADASHELKTPLAVIIASADALESNPDETKWLANIKSEGDRMNKLIADLLDLAKSEAVTDKSEFAVGDLSKLVEKASLTFEGVMFEKGVMLADEIESGIELNMNAPKMQQLMSILLDNAAKHSERGTTVEVSLKREKDIILTVTNEGEGIPKGEEEKIFERFYRADESRNRSENRYGLGLAIARNICALHNAVISAASENGKTTFRVIFKA
ncbi:MAG: HAMP domain-containing histidine kinase [Ruminococcaceae bacterium]|nr:HAMP domain-containing histidine kinase [Oscillospiraceae bacterium]